MRLLQAVVLHVGEVLLRVVVRSEVAARRNSSLLRSFDASLLLLPDLSRWRLSIEIYRVYTLYKLYTQ